MKFCVLFLLCVSMEDLMVRSWFAFADGKEYSEKNLYDFFFPLKLIAPKFVLQYFPLKHHSYNYFHYLTKTH